MKTTLKEVREKIGMTQVESANFLGASRWSFQMYEIQSKYFETLKYMYMLDELKKIYPMKFKGF